MRQMLPHRTCHSARCSRGVVALVDLLLGTNLSISMVWVFSNSIASISSGSISTYFPLAISYPRPLLSVSTALPVSSSLAQPIASLAVDLMEARLLGFA